MPDNESSVLGSLSKGHKVVVVGYENQWYKIHWNQNNYGYIHESFLSVTEKDKKFKEDNTVVMTEKVSSSLKTPYEFSCPVVTN